MDEDLFWIYVSAVAVIVFIFVGCFLLILYMNYRAEERAGADPKIEREKDRHTRVNTGS